MLFCFQSNFVNLLQTFPGWKSTGDSVSWYGKWRRNWMVDDGSLVPTNDDLLFHQAQRISYRSYADNLRLGQGLFMTRMGKPDGAPNPLQSLRPFAFPSGADHGGYHITALPAPGALPLQSGVPENGFATGDCRGNARCRLLRPACKGLAAGRVVSARPGCI